MPLPGDLNTITVTGTFKDVRGNVASGTVTFTPSVVPLIDNVGHVVVDGPTVATLNGSGQISTVLACTDNANLSAFTYTISPTINGAQTASYPAKSVPHSLGSTVDLTALLP
jgi:hypothetical protein